MGYKIVNTLVFTTHVKCLRTVFTILLYFW